MEPSSVSSDLSETRERARAVDAPRHCNWLDTRAYAPHTKTVAHSPGVKQARLTGKLSYPGLYGRR